MKRWWWRSLAAFVIVVTNGLSALWAMAAVSPLDVTNAAASPPREHYFGLFWVALVEEE